MGGASYPAGVTSVYGETLEVSTTLASLGMPGIETKQAIIYNPNCDFRLHINPAIQEVLFYDASNNVGARFERAGTTASLTRDLTDRSATGSGSAMDAATTSDRLYVRLSDIISGLHIDMTASVNTNASVMTVKYWNGSAWADITVSDGTSPFDISLAQDNNLIWTVPTDWVAAHLGGNAFDAGVKGMSITDKDAPGTEGFWLQIYWSAALSADVEIANIWTLNKNTHRGYFHGGQEYPISFDARKVGAIEAIIDEDKIEHDETDTMEITWIRTII